MISLEERMQRYESVFEGIVQPRTPIIVRLDGSNFSSYTEQLDSKPFNRKFIALMDKTAHEVCSRVQSVKFAYVASDEISLLIHPYKRFTSEPPFGGRIQKIVSITAGIASAFFTMNSWMLWKNDDSIDAGQYIDPAYFDARVFTMPENEVANYFVWRQRSYIRNAISGFARTVFSANDLFKKNSDEMLQMMKASGHDFNELSATMQRGRAILYRNSGGYCSIYDTPKFSENRNMFEEMLKTEEPETVHNQTTI